MSADFFFNLNLCFGSDFAMEYSILKSLNRPFLALRIFDGNFMFQAARRSGKKKSQEDQQGSLGRKNVQYACKWIFVWLSSFCYNKIHVSGSAVETTTRWSSGNEVLEKSRRSREEERRAKKSWKKACSMHVSEFLFDCQVFVTTKFHVSGRVESSREEA